MEHRVRTILHLMTLVPLFFLSGCEKKGEAEVEQACKSGNANLRCDLDDFGEDHDEAIKECLEDAEDAREISEECGESHLDLLSCLGDLACTNIGTWRSDKCGEMTPDYCGPEAAAFCEQCPGIWYAESVAPLHGGVVTVVQRFRSDLGLTTPTDRC